MRKTLFPDSPQNTVSTESNDIFSSNNSLKRSLSTNDVDFDDHNYCNAKRIRNREYEFYLEIMQKDIKVLLPPLWAYVKDSNRGKMCFFKIVEKTNADNAKKGFKWEKQVKNIIKTLLFYS